MQQPIHPPHPRPELATHKNGSVSQTGEPPFLRRGKGAIQYEGVINVAKHRALKGSKPRSIIVISRSEFVLGNEALELRGYVEHVECRFEEC